MVDLPVYLILGLATAFGILTLWIISYSQKYIQTRGEKVGMTQKEINKWKAKSLIFGGLFGIYLFKKALNRRG